MSFYYVFVIIISLTCLDVIATDASPCGDWEQFKDEHCYKLFDKLQSYSEAETTCNTNNSSLASIHYAEEQNFLKNYIFTKKKTIENVWIGAKYIGNKQFKWADNSILSGYSNWAAGNPKNFVDHCVEMSANEGLEGKWVEERCERKNLAICQRTPLPSIWLISQTVIELKHSLQLTNSLLAETKIKLEETKSKLDKAEKDLTKTTTNLAETNKKVALLKNEHIPIGFIYVQLPKDKAPLELWPSMTWQDISKNYEGVFFRVIGGNSENFGQVQQDNAPRLETVQSSYENHFVIKAQNCCDLNMTIPVTGWSAGIYTGNSGGNGGYKYYLNFKHTDVAEVRPKNMAIKVYRRTA